MSGIVSQPTDALAAVARRSSTIVEPVDPARWPDITSVPGNRFRAAIATKLTERVARRLPIQLIFPDGRRLGRVGTPALMIHRPDAFFRRLGAGGLIGFGEAYQAGDWSAPDLPRVLGVLASDMPRLIPPLLQRLRRFYVARHPGSDANTVVGARGNIHRHYDLSNELFAAFLDETLSYSSAVFETDAQGSPVATWQGLASAQHRKIDLLLDAARVGPGSKVLEIGTGWGELAIRAAARGARVRTVTISTEQRALALQRIAEHGVADRVTVELQDYREIPPSKYDAVLSVEMIEAVGSEYWPSYFVALDRLLAPGGRVGLQAITMPHERMLASRHTYTWMHKYIFPGGLIPSIPAIEYEAGRHTSLRLLQRHSFGAHYAATLQLWRRRFAEQSELIQALGFDEIFRRTWDFYLAYSEAGFASGYLNVYQLVLGR